jgi:hypothetical protein
MVMPARAVKEEARRLIEALPENATWDDLMYKIYVRQAIEAGLADSEASRTMDVKEVRKKFGLPE